RDIEGIITPAGKVVTQARSASDGIPSLALRACGELSCRGNIFRTGVARHGWCLAGARAVAALPRSRGFAAFPERLALVVPQRVGPQLPERFSSLVAPELLPPFPPLVDLFPPRLHQTARERHALLPIRRGGPPGRVL